MRLKEIKLQKSTLFHKAFGGTKKNKMSDEPGNRAYYLMDARVVQSSDNVCLDVCPPRKAGPILTQEKPWEAFYMHPHSLVHHEGEYLLYYLVYIVNDGPHRSATCLATSRDGLHWERPELGQVAYAGSGANNILSVGGTVSIDPSAPPERRFLMAGADTKTKQGDPGFVVDGIALHTSPDGRVWTQASPVVSPFTHDSTNQVFYDEAKGKYVAYLRAFPGRRAVAYYEPPDLFKPWPIRPGESNKGETFLTELGPAHTVYVVDELPLAMDWNGARQVYNPGVVPIEGMYLAFPDIFRIFPGPDHSEKERFPDSELYAWANDGLVAPRLYVSEDGVSFRPVGETPYIDLGFGNELDTRQVRMVTGFIECGDELWQYYGGHQTGHTLARGKRPRKSCAVMRAVQRKDGFAATRAGSEGGEVITTPTRCAGATLYVNFDAGAWGEVRVELLDVQGQPLPGYAVADSAPLVGNVVYGLVLWADRRNLLPLADKRVCVRFHLRDARLFSFKFA